MLSHQVLKVVNPDGMAEVISGLNQQSKTATRPPQQREMRLSQFAKQLLDAYDPAETEFLNSEFKRPESQRDHRLQVSPEAHPPRLRARRGGSREPAAVCV